MATTKKKVNVNAKAVKKESPAELCAAAIQSILEKYNCRLTSVAAIEDGRIVTGIRLDQVQGPNGQVG